MKSIENRFQTRNYEKKVKQNNYKKKRKISKNLKEIHWMYQS